MTFLRNYTKYGTSFLNRWSDMFAHCCDFYVIVPLKLNKIKPRWMYYIMNKHSWTRKCMCVDNATVCFTVVVCLCWWGRAELEVFFFFDRTNTLRYMSGPSDNKSLNMPRPLWQYKSEYIPTQWKYKSENVPSQWQYRLSRSSFEGVNCDLSIWDLTRTLTMHVCICNLVKGK